MILWSRHLEAITGEPVGETSEKITMRLSELRQLVADEVGNDEIKGLDAFSTLVEAKGILVGWVERLQNVEFNPSEELERRLAA